MKQKILRWIKRILLSLLGLILLIILAGFIYEQISRNIAKSKFPIQGEMVSVGAHHLNCKSWGKGEPLVVFESGLDEGGYLSWQKVQEEVSKFTSTLSYNRAGILFSERGNSPKTGEAIADELYLLLKKTNNNGPYILVGHSLAGYMLRSFIAKYPQEVAGIVFVDVSHPDQSNRLPPPAILPPPIWIGKFISSIGAVRLFNIGEYTYPNTSKSDSINIVTNAYRPKAIPAFLEELNNIELLAEEASKFNSFGDIPLIVITGTSPQRDAKFLELWMQMQKELLDLSSASKHMLADKGEHYIQLEQPEIVIQAIQELVNKFDLVDFYNDDKKML
jgi:pimeloyl-ACP methyl ester carboxylesterase